MRRALFPFLGLGALAATVAVYAQIEGGDRGVPPIDSSGSFEVSGIDVDVAGKTPDAARLGGWRIAQRKGWQLLWAKTHDGIPGGIPADSVLDGLVAGIVVEQEQVGPTRYVAKLGVLFDRARAGALLGVGGSISRSAPMLVLPVEWSGGAPISYEAQSDWQKAWARYRAGGSPIDYVRVSGSGADPLLLTAGQVQRPGRIWWRLILDQYGAADVLVPQVRLERRYPGGPVFGFFSARHGPDGRMVGGFTLRAASSDALPAMMDEGVQRIDQALYRVVGCRAVASRSVTHCARSAGRFAVEHNRPAGGRRQCDDTHHRWLERHQPPIRQSRQRVDHRDRRCGAWRAGCHGSEHLQPRDRRHVGDARRFQR